MEQENRELRGDAAIALLENQIARRRQAIAAELAPLEPSSATNVWLQTLRAVEEFINLPLFGLDDPPLEAALLAMPVTARLTNPRLFRAVRHQIAYRFGGAFASRWSLFLDQAAAIGRSFLLNSLWQAAAGFATVATLAGYLQSRRRHLVALLYTLPHACHGTRTLPAIDSLNVLLPLAELQGIALTGLYQQLMLARAVPDYALWVGHDGFAGSHDYPALESFFLEPERASIVEMIEDCRTTLAHSLEPVATDSLFSAAELRNDIRLLESAYAEFDLGGSAFAPAAELVRRLSACVEDDHWLVLEPADFQRHCDDLGLSPSLRRLLVDASPDYVANTSGHAAFVQAGGKLLSSVTLLSRFLYHWKNVCLYRNRRFQIRSGFIFEHSVADALRRQGFEVTDIKRLNRKEFDVVTLRKGVIFNIQCKNNLIDLDRLEASPERFARYHRARIASYRRALRKEEGREELLRAELRKSRIEHLLISRFPVVADDPRVIPFSRIDEIAAMADQLVAKVTAQG